MPADKRSGIDYSAKKKYRDKDDVAQYEQLRFSTLLGKYRYYREQKAVSALIEDLPNNISIADCPCGNGRWWNLLARRATRIAALDLSPAMLNSAKKSACDFKIPIEILPNDLSLNQEVATGIRNHWVPTCWRPSQTEQSRYWQRSEMKIPASSSI